MYRFLSLEEYETSPLKDKHPRPRVSLDKTEVVISTNYHDKDCNCLTHQEAIDHINNNWPEE